MECLTFNPISGGHWRESNRDRVDGRPPWGGREQLGRNYFDNESENAAGKMLPFSALFAISSINSLSIFQLLICFWFFLPEFLLLKLEFAEKALKPESAEVLNMELELVLEPLSSDKEKIFHKSNKKYFIEKMSSSWILTALLTSSLDSANSAFNRKVPPLPSSRISPKVKKPFVIKNLYVKPNREENCVKQTKASHRNQILAKK